MEDDELILHKFGQKLQQLRKNQSLDIRLTSLYKLSKALGITLSKLFEGIE